MAIGLIVVFLLALAARATYAVEHVVGGSAGWAPMVDYAKWAAGETFYVGDTLRFNYNPTSHSVNIVTRESYTTCATDNPITALSGGTNTILFKGSGSVFFICPTPGHCAAGVMKLAIVVLARTTTPTTPIPPGNTTTPRCNTTTPATLTPPTMIYSPPSNAIYGPFYGGSGFVEANYLIIEVSMVLAMVVGFMGL